MAHAGALAGVEVRAGVRRDGEKRDRRFLVVRAAAAELFARLDGGGVARIYGGFSYSPSPPDSAGDAVARAAFPSARFLLPEVELAYDPRLGASTLLARGRGRRAAAEAWRRWAGAIARRRDERPPPDRGRAPKLPAGTLTEADGSSPPAARAAWMEAVGGVLRRIAASEVDKVVLARAMDFRPDRRVDPLELALALWRDNARSHVFFYQPEGDASLVGASPEILAATMGRTCRATAVAGSAPAPAAAAERRRVATRLLESANGRAEHDFVVSHIESTLIELGCRVRRDEAPRVLDLGSIQHLESRVAAEMPPGATVLDLLAALHPTPAVCGFPRAAARAIQKESETFDRGWYSGPVGWLGSDGGAHFVPALRSALWSRNSWRLYAGAGIVAESNSAREWDETELKFRPMLRAMAMAQLADGRPRADG